MKETQYLEAQVEKAADGSFTAIASTNAVDRHGEVVDNNGWDLKAYKKNPVILWAHDHGEPAIGTSKKTWISGEGKKAQLLFQPVFHGATEQSRAMKALYEGTAEMPPVLNSFSVGFRPLESPDGVTFTKNELLEISAVNVPANAEAMMMAYKGLKQAGFEDKVIKDIGIPIEVVDKLTSMEKDIEELKSLVQAQKSVNPADEIKTRRQRMSMIKVISRASDTLLAVEKRQIPVPKVHLIKSIKKAAEIMTVAEKERL